MLMIFFSNIHLEVTTSNFQYITYIMINDLNRQKLEITKSGTTCNILIFDKKMFSVALTKEINSNLSCDDIPNTTRSIHIYMYISRPLINTYIFELKKTSHNTPRLYKPSTKPFQIHTPHL